MKSRRGMEKYAKTILSSYNQISGIITQIENVIQRRAKNSFYLRCDTTQLANELLSLGEIRKDLIELECIADDILSKIKPEDKTLILYKYMGVVPEDENFDHTSRNYFRKQIKALNNFKGQLEKIGVTETWFENKYLKIAFIKNVHKKIILEEGKKHCKY